LFFKWIKNPILVLVIYNQHTMNQLKYNSLLKLCLACILIFQISCNTDKTIDAESIVQVSNGQLTGIAGNNKPITVYKGIPFAAPPVDNLRWQAPQPPLLWEGVFKADEFCKSCVQNLTREYLYLPWTKEHMIANDVDEDCLSLNIWTPATKTTERLPVLIYIHGGAYTGGSGEVLLYDGEGLAKKGVVVVTINYRVGIMGFFTHPELTAESPNNSSGNYGLLDQIAALQWVKENITAFGGNPDNVTISGQSAGAHAVHVLTVSPLAKGLFHNAIAQSGPWSNRGRTTPLGEYEQLGTKFADTLDVKSLAELRAMSADELHTKSNEYNFRFRPNIDGWLLTDEIANIYAAGQQNDVPMLTGFNADEGSSRASYGKLTIEEFNIMGENNYGEQYEQFSKMYPATTDEEVKTSQLKQSRDASFANMYNWSTARAKTGKSNSYTYYFERETPWPEYPNYKTFHSSEVPYVFRNQHLIDRPWEPIDKELSELMSDYWVNFITTGNPNGEGLAEWPAQESKMMRFSETLKADTILDEDIMSFYEAAWKQK